MKTTWHNKRFRNFYKEWDECMEFLKKYPNVLVEAFDYYRERLDASPMIIDNPENYCNHQCDKCKDESFVYCTEHDCVEKQCGVKIQDGLYEVMDDIRQIKGD
jgi:hypothetical protein